MLSDYHVMGEQLQLLQKESTKDIPWLAWLKNLHKCTICSPETSSKALRFSNDCTKEESDELESLGCSWGELIALLRVKTRKKRLWWLEKAKKKGWSVRQLKEAIKASEGLIGGGGRRPVKGTSKGCRIDLRELLRVSTEWNDFHTDVWSQGHSEYDNDIGKLNVEDKERIRKELAKAQTQLKVLRSSAKEVHEEVKTLLRGIDITSGEKRNVSAPADD